MRAGKRAGKGRTGARRGSPSRRNVVPLRVAFRACLPVGVRTSFDGIIATGSECIACSEQLRTRPLYNSLNSSCQAGRRRRASEVLQAKLCPKLQGRLEDPTFNAPEAKKQATIGSYSQSSVSRDIETSTRSNEHESAIDSSAPAQEGESGTCKRVEDGVLESSREARERASLLPVRSSQFA